MVKDLETKSLIACSSGDTQVQIPLVPESVLFLSHRDSKYYLPDPCAWMMVTSACGKPVGTSARNLINQSHHERAVISLRHNYRGETRVPQTQTEHRLLCFPFRLYLCLSVSAGGCKSR